MNGWPPTNGKKKRVLVGARIGRQRRGDERSEANLLEREVALGVAPHRLADDEELALVQTGDRRRRVLHLALGQLDERGAVAERDRGSPGTRPGRTGRAPSGRRDPTSGSTAAPTSEYGSVTQSPCRSSQAPSADSHSALDVDGLRGDRLAAFLPSHVSALWRTSMCRSAPSSDMRNGRSSCCGGPGALPVREALAVASPHGADDRAALALALVDAAAIGLVGLRPHTEPGVPQLDAVRSPLGGDRFLRVRPSASVAGRDHESVRRLDRRLQRLRVTAELRAGPDPHAWVAATRVGVVNLGGSSRRSRLMPTPSPAPGSRAPAHVRRDAWPAPPASTDRAPSSPRGALATKTPFAAAVAIDRRGGGT